MVVFSYANMGKPNKEATEKQILKSAKRYAQIREQSFSSKTKVLRTEHGKPYLSHSSLFVSVSHTEDVLLVGVSEEPFGLDAEAKNRELRDYMSIVNRFFSKEEQEAILALPEQERKQTFLSLWVKKEAFLKYRGVGLSELSLADTKKAAGVFTPVPHESLMIYVYSEQEIQSIKVH